MTRPVTPIMSRKVSAWAMRVLADRGVQHQQHGMGRLGIDLLQHAQRSSAARPSDPPCCGAARRCRSAARRRSASSPAPARRRPARRDRRRRRAPPPTRPRARPRSSAAPPPPRGRCRRRRARPTCPRRLKRLASLPMVVVLPLPLTPTTSTTKGRRGVEDEAACSTGPSERRDLLGERRADLLAGRPPGRSACLAQALGHLGGEVSAEVGGDQQFLQPVERRLVELALGRRCRYAVGQAARGAREARFEPGEPDSARSCRYTEKPRRRGTGQADAPHFARQAVARKRHRRVMLAAAEARLLHQHRGRTATRDASERASARVPAARNTRRALLHQPARQLRHARCWGPVARAEGKDMEIIDAGLVDESERVPLEHRIALGREAGDEIGARAPRRGEDRARALQAASA